jgi:hypothetical protein
MTSLYLIVISFVEALQFPEPVPSSDAVAFHDISRKESRRKLIISGE